MSGGGGTGGAERERAVDPLAACMARVAAGDREAFGEVYDAVAPKVLRREPARCCATPPWPRRSRRRCCSRSGARPPGTTPPRGRWPRGPPPSATAAPSTGCARCAPREDREDRVVAGEGRVEYDEVSEQVLQHEDESRVRKALTGLTELQREAVVMAYWGGRTSTEISAQLGVPFPTVKTRLRDGLPAAAARPGARGARSRERIMSQTGSADVSSGGGDVDGYDGGAHDLTSLYAVDALDPRRRRPPRPTSALCRLPRGAGRGARGAGGRCGRRARRGAVGGPAGPVMAALDDVPQLPAVPASVAEPVDELSRRRVRREADRPSAAPAGGTTGRRAPRRWVQAWPRPPRPSSWPAPRSRVRRAAVARGGAVRQQWRRP